MPVYMVRAGEHGPVKIGFSTDVAGRLEKMQIDNHERLFVLRIFEGGQFEEALLHQRFADSWLHGEWHAFSKAMLGDVGLVELRDATRAHRLRIARLAFIEFINFDNKPSDRPFSFSKKAMRSNGSEPAA